MTVWPLKFAPLEQSQGLLFADDSGTFFRSDDAFLRRYVEGRLSDKDDAFLAAGGHAFDLEGDLAHRGFLYRWSQRQFAPGPMDYVVLVPTLRCDLSCGYCQVSRAGLGARGVDWTPPVLEAVLNFLDGLSTPRIKIEFQGGEPLLRLDLLNDIRRFCRDRFAQVQFVVCTNLQSVSAEAWDFLAASDTHISTSFDGNKATHTRQRTRSTGMTDDFLANLEHALTLGDAHKVSVLPTVDPANPPPAEEVIGAFAQYGLRSIYLRPVNFQGFARRRFARDADDSWASYYDDFIDALVRHNNDTEVPMSEFYFSHCLRRVLRGGHHGHVDLRNPNLLGGDYIVIDHDGALYPTDESRMMARLGQIDLSVGNVFDGIDRTRLRELNAHASNNYHEDCIHCVYQPFCGVDLFDDLSRYGRIDLPKHETSFCRRHLFIFNKLFSMLYDENPAVRSSLAAWLDVPEFDQALAPVHL